MRALVLLALMIDALASAASADPNCICRARGKEFELGQSTCLPSPKGPRIATCGMVLNNTSWQFTDTPCVISVAPTEVWQSAAARPHCAPISPQPLDP
ncbi:MAG: hypothetical protein WDO17_22595 [Alphaproteobacteria bacterium]